LYAGRHLEMDHTIPAGKKARVQGEDLEEILGNLLENACKWARHRVAVTAEWQAEWVEVRVEDDGPGLPEHLREAVMGRGVRLDESAPGAGLGLAIVRDLASVYGGSVRIEDSRLGGACVRVRLPAA
jgi:signal transduction histidine kinase